MTRVRPTCGTHSLPTRRSPGLRIPKLMRTAPAAFAVMIIGCASMAGIPPLLGFVSKEFLFTAQIEEHTSELQSRGHIVCRLLREKKEKKRLSSQEVDGLPCGVA